MKITLSKKMLKKLKRLMQAIQQNKNLPKRFRRKCKSPEKAIETLFLNEFNAWVWRYDESGRLERFLAKKREHRELLKTRSMKHKKKVKK